MSVFHIKQGGVLRFQRKKGAKGVVLPPPIDLFPDKPISLAPKSLSYEEWYLTMIQANNPLQLISHYLTG